MTKSARKKYNNIKIVIDQAPQLQKNKRKNLERSGVFMHFLKRFWGWIVAFGVVVGIVTGFPTIRNFFKTTHQLHKENNYVRGVLVPSTIGLDSVINIHLSGAVFEFPLYYFKDDFKPNSFKTMDSEYVYNFSLKLINHRLYTTVIFNDLDSNYVGKIVNDEFDFVDDEKKYDFDQGDAFMEVVDEKHNTIFEMKFEPPNNYYVQGYFNHKKTVSVTNGTSLLNWPKADPNWRDKVQKQLLSISHFSPKWKNGYSPY